MSSTVKAKEFSMRSYRHVTGTGMYLVVIPACQLCRPQRKDAGTTSVKRMVTLLRVDVRTSSVNVRQALASFITARMVSSSILTVWFVTGLGTIPVAMETLQPQPQKAMFQQHLLQMASVHITAQKRTVYLLRAAAKIPIANALEGRDSYRSVLQDLCLMGT